MYSAVPPGVPRRPSPARRVLIVAAALVVVAALGVGGWLGSHVVQRAISPSGDSVLAQLRRVPHPPGAVEVAHRTARGSYGTKPSAWLTYQLPGAACPAALATFLRAGAREQGVQASNPDASYCKPTGKGFESFCMPIVCFFADFISDGNPNEYTISTGPDGEG